MAAPPAQKVWKPRTPDAKDRAVLPQLYEARLLNADQLLRLYGLSSMGALHPRLMGLLAADGGPHLLERGLGLDGRYVYALGPAGYKLLPAARRERVRHRPLGSLALSPQFLDHALAVGWVMTTWLTGTGPWQPAGSTLSWAGEHTGALSYKLPRPQGPITHGRVEPDGVLLLHQADGAVWAGPVEVDRGTEDATDWEKKLARWAAVFRQERWQNCYGDVEAHLLVIARAEADRDRLAGYLAQARADGLGAWVWIAVQADVALSESASGPSAERVTAPVWRQVRGARRVSGADALVGNGWSLAGIIRGTAPWRERPQPVEVSSPTPPPATSNPQPSTPKAPPPDSWEIQERQALLTENRELRAERDKYQRMYDASVSTEITQARALAAYQYERDEARALLDALPTVRVLRAWAAPRGPFDQLVRLASTLWAGLGLLVLAGWLRLVWWEALWADDPALRPYLDTPGHAPWDVLGRLLLSPFGWGVGGPLLLLFVAYCLIVGPAPPARN